MADDVTERIKKLLRLAKSPNQHEAQLAMERAFEIAEKNSVDLDALDLDDETRRIIHKDVRFGMRIAHESRLALNVVNAFFNVRVVVARPAVHIIGTVTDIMIAEYVVEFLVSTVRRQVQVFSVNERRCHRRATSSKTRSYVQGFFYGIVSTLTQRKEKILLTESGFGLILRTAEDRRKDYMDANFQTRQTSIQKSRLNQSALVSGWVDGKSCTINKPIGGERVGGLLEAGHAA